MVDFTEDHIDEEFMRGGRRFTQRSFDAEELVEGEDVEVGAVADSLVGPFTNRACPIKPTAASAAAGTAIVNGTPVSHRRLLMPNRVRGMSPRMIS